MKAFKAETIQNGFAATGLMPFDPDRVYQQLNIQLKTPTPPRKSIQQFTVILFTNSL
jgi:hypothetical protein